MLGSGRTAETCPSASTVAHPLRSAALRSLQRLHHAEHLDHLRILSPLNQRHGLIIWATLRNCSVAMPRTVTSRSARASSAPPGACNPPLLRWIAAGSRGAHHLLSYLPRTYRPPGRLLLNVHRPSRRVAASPFYESPLFQSQVVQQEMGT